MRTFSSACEGVHGSDERPKRRLIVSALQWAQPGLTFEHPVVGFQVESVHSIALFSLMPPPAGHDSRLGQAERAMVVTPCANSRGAGWAHLTSTAISVQRGKQAHLRPGSPCARTQAL
jgi:hypothetical protein